MKVYKIHTKLWRVLNNGKTKDVFVDGNIIIEADNPYNILTDKERLEVELYLKKK